MGYASMMASAGAVGRAESERCLLTNENRKRILVDSSVTTARITQLDQRANEAKESAESVVNKYFDLQSAKEAKTVADLAVASAVVGLVGGIAGGIADGNIGNAITAGISGVFSLAGAIVAALGASAEVEMLKTQYGELSADSKLDQKNTNALVANGL